MLFQSGIAGAVKYSGKILLVLTMIGGLSLPTTAHATGSLDFADFKEAMALDANTSINFGSSNLTTSGNGGLSFGHSGGTTFSSDTRVGGAEAQFAERSSPPTLNADVTLSRTFSPDGKFMVTGGNSSASGAGEHCLNMWVKSGSTYTLVTPNPFTAQVSNIYCTSWHVQFSDNGRYLLVTYNSNGSPFAKIYKVNGNSYGYLTELTLEASSAASTYGSSMTPGADYIVVSLTSSPYLNVFKRNGDSFTKLADPSSLPTGQPVRISFSGDGAYLAVGHDTAPYITIYKRTGNSLTKLANPDVLPGGTVQAVQFSPDSTHLAIGETTSTSRLKIYKRTGDVFTKIADPNVNASAHVDAIEYSPDGKYLVADTENSSPYFYIYKRSGDSYTKMANPSTLPLATVVSAKFTPDGKQLFLSYSGYWANARVVWYDVISNAALEVNGALNANNGLVVNGQSTTLNTNLTVNGISNLTRDVSIGTDDYAAALSIKGALSVGGAIAITGNATFNGAASFKQAVEFAEDTTFKDDTVFEKGVKVGKNLMVSTNTAGRKAIDPGQQYIGINFTQPYYSTKPVVTGVLAEVNFSQTLFNQYVSEGKCLNTTLDAYAVCMQKARQAVQDMNYTIIQQGIADFQVALKTPAEYKMEFNWTAVEVAP